MFKKKSVRRKLYVYLTFWTSYSDFWQVLESFTINRPWGSMWELQATDTWYTVKEPTTYWNFPLLFFPFKISLLTKNSLLAFLEINERSKCCQTVSNIGRFWYFKSPFIIALFRLQTALTFQWRLPHIQFKSTENKLAFLICLSWTLKQKSMPPELHVQKR